MRNFLIFIHAHLCFLPFGRYIKDIIISAITVRIQTETYNAPMQKPALNFCVLCVYVNTVWVIGINFSAIYVYKSEKKPCRNFPAKYGLRLRPDLETTPMTCKCTLIPAKAHTHEEIIILLKSDVSKTDILFSPDTNSIILDNIASEVGFICIRSMIRLDITLQKMTTPHTVRILFIEFEITSENIRERFLWFVVTVDCGAKKAFGL